MMKDTPEGTTHSACCANCRHWQRDADPERAWTDRWGPPQHGTCTGRANGDPMHDATRSRSHQDHHCEKWAARRIDTVTKR